MEIVDTMTMRQINFKYLLETKWKKDVVDVKRMGDKIISLKIKRSKKIPHKLMRIILILIYKNKKDIQNCVNYKGIKLMAHFVKL
ncbi:hypothetical protein Lal_00002627 [Lupinus albus]|nr:hypothetical protein Lal_00002627 [Lupinus albus]